MRARKRPFAALLLSLALPGLGQLYNQEPTKGVVVFAACVGLALMTYWLSTLNAVTAGLALTLVWISAVVDAFKVAQASGQPVDFYYKTAYVVAMLLLVGPLALPLLWRSPYFSRFARWTWTFVVVGAALLFVATPYLMNWLIRRAPELAPLLRQ